MNDCEHYSTYSLLQLLESKGMHEESIRVENKLSKAGVDKLSNDSESYIQNLSKDLEMINQLIEIRTKETKYGQMANFNETGHNKLGEFKVSSGALMATDPCYKPGAWCQIPIQNVKNGTWFAYGFFTNEGSWGLRCAEFVAAHDEHAGRHFFKDLMWKQEKGDVGVDSGQAGVFDMGIYKTSVTGEEDYDKICDMTMNLDDNGNVLKGTPVIDYGWATSSGFGDGGYDCFVAKDSTGKVVGVRIVFIGDDGEE